MTFFLVPTKSNQANQTTKRTKKKLCPNCGTVEDKNSYWRVVCHVAS